MFKRLLPFLAAASLATEALPAVAQYGKTVKKNGVEVFTDSELQKIKLRHEAAKTARQLTLDVPTFKQIYIKSSGSVCRDWAAADSAFAHGTDGPMRRSAVVTEQNEILFFDERGSGASHPSLHGKFNDVEVFIRKGVVYAPYGTDLAEVAKISYSTAGGITMLSKQRSNEYREYDTYPLPPAVPTTQHPAETSRDVLKEVKFAEQLTKNAPNFYVVHMAEFGYVSQNGRDRAAWITPKNDTLMFSTAFSGASQPCTKAKQNIFIKQDTVFCAPDADIQQASTVTSSIFGGIVKFNHARDGDYKKLITYPSLAASTIQPVTDPVIQAPSGTTSAHRGELTALGVTRNGDPVVVLPRLSDAQKSDTLVAQFSTNATGQDVLIEQQRGLDVSFAYRDTKRGLCTLPGLPIHSGNTRAVPVALRGLQKRVDGVPFFPAKVDGRLLERFNARFR